MEKQESANRPAHVPPESQALDARDHRKLGQRLGLFALDPAVGKGLPLWLPNGTVIRDELEKLARSSNSRRAFNASRRRISRARRCIAQRAPALLRARHVSAARGARGTRRGARTRGDPR